MLTVTAPVPVPELVPVCPVTRSVPALIVVPPLKVLFAVSGYVYGERLIDRAENVAAIRERLPTLEAVVDVEYAGGAIPGAVPWADLLRETGPLAGAAVSVRLRDDKGKVYPVAEAKAGGDGVAAVQFQVPAVPPGSYKMEVVTKSTLGEEKLERDVKVKVAPATSLADLLEYAAYEKRVADEAH